MGKKYTDNRNIDLNIKEYRNREMENPSIPGPHRN